MGQSNRLFLKQFAFWAMLLVLIVATVLAWVSEEWRVSNLVIGFLFGFFLQRGSFCGASILSSVVLYKDFWGLTGVGTALFTSMAGFAGLSRAGPAPTRDRRQVAGYKQRTNPKLQVISPQVPFPPYDT